MEQFFDCTLQQIGGELEQTTQLVAYFICSTIVFVFCVFGRKSEGVSFIPITSVDDAVGKDCISVSLRIS